MKNFFLGAIVGIVTFVSLVVAYFFLGIAPVSTAAGPMPFEHYLAKSALNARVHKEMPKTVPITGNESNYLAGAKIYRENCAVCHGLPGQSRPSIGVGLYPKAPALFIGKGVTDDSPGETYWKVVNGIRLTGMPRFQLLSETQAWQVSILLANADRLPISVLTDLSSPNPQSSLKKDF